MKSINFLLAIFAVVLMTSCEKVIDVDLKGSGKKYVIEGVLTDQEGGGQVRITRTSNMDENNRFEGISGAQVSVTDGKGITTIFNEGSAGIYRSNLRGVPGEAYSLQVNINGAVFTAISHMPSTVFLDSLYISEMDMMGTRDKLANAVFKDPEGGGNAYRFVQFINGKKSRHFFVQNDDLSDGRKITVSLFNHDSPIQKGDTVTVEMQGIDPAVYTYWFSLFKGATGENENATPANPVTNISGGALGYFSAHTVSSKSIVVK
jgi:hypothetical protein